MTGNPGDFKRARERFREGSAPVLRCVTSLLGPRVIVYIMRELAIPLTHARARRFSRGLCCAAQRMKLPVCARAGEAARLGRMRAPSVGHAPQGEEWGARAEAGVLDLRCELLARSKGTLLGTATPLCSGLRTRRKREGHLHRPAVTSAHAPSLSRRRTCSVQNPLDCYIK